MSVQTESFPPDIDCPICFQPIRSGVRGICIHEVGDKYRVYYEYWVITTTMVCRLATEEEVKLINKPWFMRGVGDFRIMRLNGLVELDEERIEKMVALV